MFGDKRNTSAGLMGNSGRYAQKFPPVGLSKGIPMPNSFFYSSENLYKLETNLLVFDSELLNEVWVANSKDLVDKLNGYSLNELLREIDRSRELFKDEVNDFSDKYGDLKLVIDKKSFLVDYKRMYNSFLKFFAAERALQFLNPDDNNFPSISSFDNYLKSIEHDNQEFYNQFDSILVSAMTFYYKEFVVPKFNKNNTELKAALEKTIKEEQKKELFKGP